MECKGYSIWDPQGGDWKQKKNVWGAYAKKKIMGGGVSAKKI